MPPFTMRLAGLAALLVSAFPGLAFGQAASPAAMRETMTVGDEPGRVSTEEVIIREGPYARQLVFFRSTEAPGQGAFGVLQIGIRELHIRLDLHAARVLHFHDVILTALHEQHVARLNLGAGSCLQPDVLSPDDVDDGEAECLADPGLFQGLAIKRGAGLDDDLAQVRPDAELLCHLRRCGTIRNHAPADEEHVQDADDPIIVRQNWLRAYDFTTDKGALALNDYARSNDPFAQVGKVQVAVDVSSVIRASADSFRVAGPSMRGRRRR